MLYFFTGNVIKLHPIGEERELEFMCFECIIFLWWQRTQ